MPGELSMSEADLREARAALQRSLDLLPDPDAKVHAWDLKRERALCGSTTKRPRKTDIPSEVTCNRCKRARDWAAWQFRTTEKEG